MKKPKNYEIKKWLCCHYITSITIFWQSGLSEEANNGTWWILKPHEGRVKRLKDTTVEPLVLVRPDYKSVLRATDETKEEVNLWDKFAEEEAKDLAELARLQAKYK